MDKDCLRIVLWSRLSRLDPTGNLGQHHLHGSFIPKESCFSSYLWQKCMFLIMSIIQEVSFSAPIPRMCTAVCIPYWCIWYRINFLWYLPHAQRSSWAFGERKAHVMVRFCQNNTVNKPPQTLSRSLIVSACYHPAPLPPRIAARCGDVQSQYSFTHNNVDNGKHDIWKQSDRDPPKEWAFIFQYRFNIRIKTKNLPHKISEFFRI